MSGTLTTATLDVPANTPTELVAATASCTGIRITYYPKLNGQILYLGTSNTMTVADGYPIPPGVEYQLPSVTVALYGLVLQGGATVSVEVFS